MSGIRKLLISTAAVMAIVAVVSTAIISVTTPAEATKPGEDGEGPFEHSHYHAHDWD